MNITAIIIACAAVGGTGIIVGIILAIAGDKFKVEVDPKEEAVLNALPGNNCGGCGYPGCSGLAAAIAKGEADIASCPVGGAPVAAAIGEIMGQEVGETTRMTAYVKCAGTCEKAKENYKYYGVESCAAMSFVPAGGPKACSYGCLGYGECVKACGFDAIHVVDGIAVVDKEACKACGKCVEACPRHLIDLIPYDSKYAVQCSSRGRGKDVMSVCSVGCIGCGMCKRVCKFDAIVFEDNIARIDQDKCKGCGACAAKCPKKIIEKTIA